jgi:hypothetical protein
MTKTTAITTVFASWILILLAGISCSHAKGNIPKKPQTFMGDFDWFQLHPLAFCINFDDTRPRSYVPLMCAVPEDFALSRMQGQDYDSEGNEYSVKKGDGVVLDNSLSDTEEGWRLEFVDGATLFRTAAASYEQSDEGGFCLQAGHGSEVKDQGVRIRLYPCDSSSPLQRFVWYEEFTSCDDDQVGGSIRLESYPSLCLGWNRGTYLQPAKNQLVMYPCKNLPPFQNSGWTAF